jgi:hypothetical protein
MRNRLTENDLNRITKKVLSEQQGEGKFTGGGMGKGGLKQTTSDYTVNLDGSLFENGMDQIDQSSPAFKKGIDSIRKAIIDSSMSGGKTPTIQIVGGASAVGQKSGYDNTKLANRRANNFFNIVKSVFPEVKFSLGAPIVGVATVKNSPEAKKEQFVKLNIQATSSQLYDVPAIDHTTNKLNPDARYKKKKPVKYETVYIVCFELTESEYNSFKNSKISNKIVSAKKK